MRKINRWDSTVYRRHKYIHTRNNTAFAKTGINKKMHVRRVACRGWGAVGVRNGDKRKEQNETRWVGRGTRVFICRRPWF